MAIYGIEGGIGSGKTITLVKWSMTALKKGRSVITNIKLKNLTPSQEKKVRYIDKDFVINMFDNVKKGRVNLKNTTIYLQEIHNYMDSRTSISKKNRMLSYWILQSRHTGKGTCDICYDTQDFGQIDLRLRNQTDFFVRPKIYRDDVGTPFLVTYTITAKIGQKWRRFSASYDPRLVFEYYDTHEIVDF